MSINKPEVRRLDVRTGTKPEIGRVNLGDSINVDVQTLVVERFPYGRYLKTADNKSEYILDENGVTILLFEGDGSGNFNSIYSPLSKDQLRTEILCLSEEQQRDLEQRLSLPPAKPADVEKFRRIQAGRDADRKLLEQIMILKLGFSLESQAQAIDQRLVRGILQKEYAITNGNSEIPVIGTFGLGPCIAVVAHDPETSTAALAHVDGTTRVDSIGEQFHDMGVIGEELKRVRVGLIGGDGSSRKQAIEMIRYLQGMGIVLSYADILYKPHPTGFVIDSRNGVIIPNVTPHNNGEYEDLRMQISEFQMNAPIKKEFDGRLLRKK